MNSSALRMSQMQIDIEIGLILGLWRFCQFKWLCYQPTLLTSPLYGRFLCERWCLGSCLCVQWKVKLLRIVQFQMNRSSHEKYPLAHPLINSRENFTLNSSSFALAHHKSTYMNLAKKLSYKLSHVSAETKNGNHEATVIMFPSSNDMQHVRH